MSDQPALPKGLEDLRGEIFEGRYELTEIRVVGSNHVLFSGTAAPDAQPIVLELFRPISVSDRSSAERLARRVKATRRIRHPNIVCPTDSGERFNGTLFLVSDRPPGVPLSEFMSERPDGRLTWAEARPLLLDLARGLAIVHRRRLVHGVLWPGMCWVEAEEHQQPKLRLLGLGSNVDPTEQERHASASGTAPFAGDPHYVAPETVRGLLGDARSDIYLLGLLAYTMVVGEPPFCSGGPFQVLAAHLKESVSPASERVPELPEGIDAFFAAVLAKKADDRPQKMAEVEAMLLELALPGPELLAAPAGRRPSGYVEAPEPAPTQEYRYQPQPGLAHAPSYHQAPPPAAPVRPFAPPAAPVPPAATSLDPPEAWVDPNTAAPSHHEPASTDPEPHDAQDPMATAVVTVARPVRDGQTKQLTAIDDAVALAATTPPPSSSAPQPEPTVSLSLSERPELTAAAEQSPVAHAEPPASGAGPRTGTEVYDTNALEAAIAQQDARRAAARQPDLSGTLADSVPRGTEVITLSDMGMDPHGAVPTAPPHSPPGGAPPPVIVHPPSGPLPTQPAPSPAAPPRKSSSLVLWLVLTAVVAALAGIAIGLSLGSR